MSGTSGLPPAVEEALARGDLIGAIKLLRSSGVGLKEAKDALDAHVKGKAGPVFAPPMSGGKFTGPLPADVAAALSRGQKIEAIRLMREQTGLGLKEAKEAVEASGVAASASGLSPGQVAPTSNKVWWIVVLALLALAGYFILRRFG
jgi:ribosomal protein L7/L12